MKENRDTPIKEKVWEYLHKRRQSRYFRIIAVLLAIVVVCSTVMGLRYYGHALSENDVESQDDDTEDTGEESDDAEDDEPDKVEASDDENQDDEENEKSESSEEEQSDKTEKDDKEDEDESLEEDEEESSEEDEDESFSEEEESESEEKEEEETETKTEDEEEVETETESEVIEAAINYLQNMKSYEDSRIEVTASYSEAAKIPDEAELQVVRLAGNQYDDAVEKAGKAAPNNDFDTELTYAYDICFICAGEEIEPQDTVNITFRFKDDKYEDKKNLTVVHLAEDGAEVIEDIRIDDGESTIEVDSFSIYVITTDGDEKEGTDISENISFVKFYLRDGNIWREKEPNAEGKYLFCEEDQVHAEIKFENVSPDALKNGIAAIKLPDSMNIPDDLIEKTKAFCDASGCYSGGDAGTFYIDKNGTAVLQFHKEYLEWAAKRSNMKGYIEFEFYWDVKETTSVEETEQIKIGSYEGTVIIKKQEQQIPSEQGYWAYKQVKDIVYNNDGSVTLTYNIIVKVPSTVTKMITLKDKIDPGVQFEKIQYSYMTSEEKEQNLPDNYIVLTQDSDTQKIITIGDSQGVNTGTYTISYTATYTKEQLQNKKGDNITNQIKYGEWSSNTTYTYVVPTITKSGNLLDADTGYVKWTINVNRGGTGSIFDFFEKDEIFKDDLPQGTELAGEVKIIQYDVCGSKIGEIKCNSTKNTDGTTTLSATLPAGKYQYEITYYTKQTNMPPVGERVIIENEAEAGGDKAQASVETMQDRITKSFVENKTTDKTYYEIDGIKYEVMEIAWKVSIRGGVQKDTTFYDTNADWAAANLMTDEQMKKMVVKAGDKVLKSEEDYKVAAYDKGVFQITFLRDISENISIDYTCYADVTNVPINGGCNVCNLFDGVQASKWIEKKYQSKSENLYKYIKGTEPKKAESNVDLGLKRVLSWEICVDEEKQINNPHEVQTFVDTIPKGLTFVPDSLKIQLNWYVNVEKFPEMYFVETEVQKDGSTKLTISFNPEYDRKTMQAAGCWWKNSESDGSLLKHIVITYDTVITDEDLLGGSNTSASYTNTVEWGDEWNEHTVHVTRLVIGKNGNYDEEQKKLQYAVIINPDYSDLNPDGDLLKLEDTLTAVSGITITFDKVGLYSIITNSSGDYVPGTEVAKLTSLETLPGKNDSVKENTYYYDDATNKITAYIRDGQAYALVYSYFVAGKLANDVTVSNKAELSTGSKSYKEVTTGVKVTKASLNAGVNTEGITILLEKRDAGYYNKQLGNARFQLYKWSGNHWKEVEQYITKEGQATSIPVECDTFYKLEEKEAPQGYILGQNNESYFVVTTKDDLSFPEEHDWNVFQYKENQHYSIEMLNGREKTNIKVSKSWQNPDGADASRISGSVTFGLFRKKVPYASEMEEQPDVIVLQDTELAGYADYNAYKRSHNEEFVKEYTIDYQKLGGTWSLELDGLEKMSEDPEYRYKYYVVEKSSITSDNDKLIETKYSIDEDNSLIITNIITSEYSLPETGGKGSVLHQVIMWLKTLFEWLIP